MPFAIRKRDTGEWLFKPRRNGEPRLVDSLDKATTWVGKAHAKQCLHNLSVPELLDVEIELVEVQLAPLAIVEIVELKLRSGSTHRREMVKITPRRRGFRDVE